jgi:O-antigen ligase
MKMNKLTYYYFFVIFSILPISIVIGSSISLINVVIIDLSFLILLVQIKNFLFVKNKAFKLLLILYVYLIFNSFISINPELGIFRNLGFIRVIILFVAFNYFFNIKFFFKKVFFIWFIFLTFIVLDVFLESFSGRNLFGYGEMYGKRIVSFFRDEPIVGWYINSFYFLIIGYLFDYFQKENKYKIFLLLTIILVAIILTGERASSIKAILGIAVFFLLFKEINLQKKILFLSSFFILLLIIFINTEHLKYRFLNQIFFAKAGQSFLSNLNDTLYVRHYRSGIEVFKKNKVLGVGNKNYRLETCKNKNEMDLNQKKNYLCSTHPHQIYFELLSEHGLFGTVLILIIFYNLILLRVLKDFDKETYLHKGSFIYLLSIFFPLIPSGAFFSDYSLTILAINLSIFYGSSKKLNIFKNNK